MKFTCKISRPTPETLNVRLFVTSHRIPSPLIDKVDLLEEDRENTQQIPYLDDEASAVEIQTLCYAPSLSSSPIHQLPPFLLIEPCDDPEEAEANYEQQGGYHYIGQIVLPDSHLGERVDVIITREALQLWDTVVSQSKQHRRAQTLWRQKQDALFQPDPSEFNAPPIAPEIAPTLERLCRQLRAPHAQLRQEALINLHAFAPAIPIDHVFPLLNDPEEQVYQTALALLSAVADYLPTEHLYHITGAAQLRARITAMTLLGAQQHEDAAQDLICITATGPLRRERAAERIALLHALAQASSHHPRGSLMYRDLVDVITEVEETDPLLRVRQVARGMLQTLLITK